MKSTTDTPTVPTLALFSTSKPQRSFR